MPLLIWTAISFGLMLLGLAAHSRVVYSIGIACLLLAFGAGVFRALHGRRGARQ